MKVRLPAFYVPYGPVGHPKAQVFSHLLSFGSKEDLEGSFYNYLERDRGQGNSPTMFYQERLSLAENGYHILEVEGDEISDELIAALPVPAIYVPMPHGSPGRKLADLMRYLPNYFKLGTEEVWEPGVAGCDHDFNLVSYEVMFKCQWTDEKFTYEDTYGSDFNRDGRYYGTLKCSRCGEVHALPEPEST
jgi:hypothetical protein